MEVSQKFSFGQCDQMLKNVAQVFPTVAQKVANQLDLKSDGFTTAQKVTKHLGNKFIVKKLKKIAQSGHTACRHRCLVFLLHDFSQQPLIRISNWEILCILGLRPGLVVIGGYSYHEGRGFESLHCILDGHFSQIFVVKFLMLCWKDENKQKGAGDGPFKKTLCPIGTDVTLALNCSPES